MTDNQKSVDHYRIQTLEKRMENHEEGCERRQNKIDDDFLGVKTRLTVMETEVKETRNDVREIKNDVKDLVKAVNSNTNLLMMQKVKIAGFTAAALLVLGIIARWAWPLIVA